MKRGLTVVPDTVNVRKSIVVARMLNLTPESRGTHDLGVSVWDPPSPGNDSRVSDH